MLYKSLVGFALAATAVASPLTDVTAQPISRTTRDPCNGGRVFVGWLDESKGIIPQCKCPKSQIWDKKRHKCISPPLVPPVLGAGQRIICATNPNSYTNYDADDDLCLDNGQNVVLAVLNTLSEVQLKQQILEKCKKKPKCPAGQIWSEKHKKCKHPSLPPDGAQKCKKKGGKPICAKTPTNYCDYDEDRDQCQDDGQNCLQCLDLGLGDTVGKILDGVFATVDEALGALGRGCVLDGLGCVLNDAVWDKLIGGSGLGGVICGIPIIGGILGICP